MNELCPLHLFKWPLFKIVQHVLVEKKKETITESAGRQQKKKIGKITIVKLLLQL